MTPLLAPRFLASAFAAGPALLILLALLLRRVARFDVGREAIRTLSVIVAYAMIANVFFVAMERTWRGNSRASATTIHNSRCG